MSYKIVREAADPLAQRLSIGSPNGTDPQQDGYIVYRGDPDTCLEVLRTATAELEKHVANKAWREQQA